MVMYRFTGVHRPPEQDLPDDETAIDYLDILGQVGDEVLTIERDGEVIWRRATEVYSGLLWKRSMSLELQAVFAGARGHLGTYKRLMALHSEVKRMARWLDREAGRDPDPAPTREILAQVIHDHDHKSRGVIPWSEVVELPHYRDGYSAQRAYALADKLVAATPRARSEIHNREFQMMLARIIYRHGKGRDLSHTVAGARNLLVRRGVLSVLRGVEEPEDDNSALIDEDSPLGELLRAHVETLVRARDVFRDMCGHPGGDVEQELTGLLRDLGAEVSS